MRIRRLCLIIFAVLILQASTGTLYVSKGNIFYDEFSDAYESCFFVMHDGERYEFTTREEGRINVPISIWVDTIESDGYTLGDVTIIMHNHFASPRFSETDKKTYTLLKMSGFVGSFGVYVMATDKAYLIDTN